MASLRTTVGIYKNELKEGVAHVAFWKDGRSWNGSAFWLDSDGRIEPEDIQDVKEIIKEDPNAILVNGYTDCPFSDEDPGCTVEFMAGHIKFRYEQGSAFLLRDRLPSQEDKQLICDLLLPALQATRNLSDLAELTYSASEETVTATFLNGCFKKVNVACDSGTSMIRDIMNHIL